jgi:DNA-binding NtrC family response regulator
MMSHSPVVLVQANNLAHRPLKAEVDPIDAVVSTMGGESIPLSVTCRLRPAPDVAIILGACWPQWRDALRELKSAWQETQVLGILGEEATHSNCLQSALAGDLSDFLLMPVREAELRVRIDRLLTLSRWRTNEEDIHAFKVEHQLESLLGDSDAFVRVLRIVPLLAAVDATILITGETGTGKELIASALHYGGPRRSGPFVPCNCGALPDYLLENELFGHAPGAYTDARAEQKGLLAISDGGTLFLDEIDSLNLSAQVKLLRLLQDREYRPLGSAQIQHANIRIMAATNRKLKELVAQKLFREDLYHRLNVLHLDLPSLRERLSDVPGLAQEFLRRFGMQFNRPALRFSVKALQALQAHDWPGNVRELESVVQRAVILSKTLVIEAVDLELPEVNDASAPVIAFERAKRKAMDDFEHSYLIQLLSEQTGNVSRAAQQAGKDRRTFQRLLRKYNLSAADYRH